jgi:2-polyprenyl-3-methyl-5-hydroxy-6-metoxy-1,4-benzoquinol methylase
MLDLPNADTYEKELFYMPYRKSLQRVIDVVVHDTPRFDSVIDLMCGPGYLLGKIAEKRPDLRPQGVDIDDEYIAYARKKHPSIDFCRGDVTKYDFSPDTYDVVLCTGALHHIPYHKQEDVVKSMAQMMKPDGFTIISDAHTDDYANEQERMVAAAKLGHEYLRATILNGAPLDVISATANIIKNDVVMDEFKTSLKKRLNIVKRIFKNVDVLKTWPDFGSEYGDYILVCRS